MPPPQRSSAGKNNLWIATCPGKFSSRAFSSLVNWGFASTKKASHFTLEIRDFLSVADDEAGFPCKEVTHISHLWKRDISSSKVFGEAICSFSGGWSCRRKRTRLIQSKLRCTGRSLISLLIRARARWWAVLKSSCSIHWFLRMEKKHGHINIQKDDPTKFQLSLGTRNYFFAKWKTERLLTKNHPEKTLKKNGRIDNEKYHQVVTCCFVIARLSHIRCTKLNVYIKQNNVCIYGVYIYIHMFEQIYVRIYIYTYTNMSI